MQHTNNGSRKEGHQSQTKVGFNVRMVGNGESETERHLFRQSGLLTTVHR